MDVVADDEKASEPSPIESKNLGEACTFSEKGRMLFASR